MAKTRLAQEVIQSKHPLLTKNLLFFSLKISFFVVYFTDIDSKEIVVRESLENIRVVVPQFVKGKQGDGVALFSLYI